MKTININGKVYNKTNELDTFTYSQQKIGKKLVVELYKLLDARKDSIERNTDDDLNVDFQKVGMDLLPILSSVDAEPRILALLYIEESETYFKSDTYEARVKSFMDANITVEMVEDLKDFFYTKMSLVTQNILTYISPEVVTQAEQVPEG